MSGAFLLLPTNNMNLIKPFNYAATTNSDLTGIATYHTNYGEMSATNGLGTGSNSLLLAFYLSQREDVTRVTFWMRHRVTGNLRKVAYDIKELR